MRAATLVFALAFPTVMAWLYFVDAPLRWPAADGPNRLAQLLYVGGKGVQFMLPLVWWRFAGRPTADGRPKQSAWPVSLLFGVAVAVAMVALYHVALAGSPAFQAAVPALHAKVTQLGAATPARFLILSAFLTLVHSGLEEYYWRGFVDRALGEQLPTAWAVTLSSLGFMGHHVVVLAVYFPRDPLLVAGFSAGIAVGGASWAWATRRGGSLAPAWASHAIVDAAIMLIGYELLFGPVAIP